MIDQTLITQGSLVATQSISSAKPTSINGLWRIENFFDIAVMSKLIEYFNNVDHSHWQEFNDEKYHQRKKITWQSDTVVEELHEICDSITEKIREISPTAQHYWGINLWKDSENYFMDWHTDNTDIDMSLQIYLSGPENCPGTIFRNSENVVEFEFVPNNGYLTDQGINQIEHKFSGAVGPGYPRYSLHAVWSRFPKNLSNAQ
jgi:hypothetical protein